MRVIFILQFTLEVFFFWLSGSTCLIAQTYYKEVEPILIKNCSPCHRPGESAPFTLLSYSDAAKRADFIKKVVSSKYMPPWKADNAYVHFANDRSLSVAEINIIVNWVDNGAKEGKKQNEQNSRSVLSPLSLTAYGRQPDLTLMALDTFILKGDNKERFVEFKIPFELPAGANIEAVEFYSNNKKIIHHANYAVQVIEEENIDISAAPTMVNQTDGQRYLADPYIDYKKQLAYYGGWIPGSGYEAYPDGVGWIMPRRGVILLTIHYAPSAAEEKSSCGINLFFTKKPIERKVTVVSFGSGGLGELDITPMFFMIPAGKESTYSLRFTNPSEDFSLLYIWPHMHYIGKEFKAYLTTAAQDTIPLVHIPNWDYRWQEMYRYKKFLKIPKGAVVHMECTYDNTDKNPFNPFNPPQTIYSYGDMRATQEMMTMLLIYTPYKDGDEGLSTTNERKQD